MRIAVAKKKEKRERMLNEIGEQEINDKDDHERELHLSREKKIKEKEKYDKDLDEIREQEKIENENRFNMFSAFRIFIFRGGRS